MIRGRKRPQRYTPTALSGLSQAERLFALVDCEIGSAVDTMIFFSLAFSAAFIWLEPANDVSWATGPVPLLGFGPEVPLWQSLALADFCVKVAVDLIALMPFRLAIAKYTSRTA